MTELFDILPAAPILHTFVQYLIAFFSRPKAVSDVIFGSLFGLIFLDKYAKLRDFCLNCSGEILQGLRQLFAITFHWK